MAKVRPVSQLPATSRVAKESGRKTERAPCVIHLSGNIAATCCIQYGRSVKIKKIAIDKEMIADKMNKTDHHPRNTKVIEDREVTEIHEVKKENIK